jgi:hypothetical protein
MHKVRCKLSVNAMRDVGSCIQFEMGAVYSSRPDSENKSFSEATPSAYFSMNISKSAPASLAPFLHPGAEVYVDLSLADIPEWNWGPDRYPEVGRKVEIRVDNLEPESIIGVFDRKTLEESQHKGCLYPQIKKEDGTVFLLQDIRFNSVQYYWKYI